MNPKKIAVLGAGHGGYGMAADLTLAGCEVHFYGSRERGNLKPICIMNTAVIEKSSFFILDIPLSDKWLSFVI